MPITYFDAENGVDGNSITIAGMPASGGGIGIAGNGAYIRYDGVNPLTGRLSYHFHVVSGANTHVQLGTTAGSTQAFRAALRIVNIPTATRRIIQWVSSGILKLQLNSSSQLQLVDGPSGKLGSVSVSAGIDYDVSIWFTSGASTNDGNADMRIYQKNTNTLVGSTSWTAGSIAAASSGLVHLGSNESGAADLDYIWDNVRFAADQGEFPAPITASCNMTITGLLSASAHRIPYVRDAILGLEE